VTKKPDSVDPAFSQDPWDAPPSSSELADARRFADALSHLEHGRQGLDALPNMDAQDPLGDWVAMAALARYSHPTSPTPNLAAIWEDIADQTASQPLVRPAQARWRWRWVGWGAAVAVALLLLISTAIQPEAPKRLAPPSASMSPPAAVAQLDADRSRYVSTLQHRPDPSGDTRWRAYRQARLDAWRQDLTWQHRFGRRRSYAKRQ